MQPVEQEYAVGKISVMASSQFLRTCKGVNSNRSMRTWRARAASACGAWTRTSVACSVPPRLASRLRMQQNNAPERSASARVQALGGAVFMEKGQLVFDGVAISDTSAMARRPRPRAPVGPSGYGPERPVPDRCRAQELGGAIYMGDGAVTFRGSSTISRTQAVRPARRTHARARTCY